MVVLTLDTGRPATVETVDACDAGRDMGREDAGDEEGVDSVHRDEADIDMVVTRGVVLHVLAHDFSRVPVRVVLTDMLDPLVFLCQLAS